MANPAVPAVPVPGPGTPSKAMLLLVCDFVKDMIFAGSFSQAVDHLTSAVRPSATFDNLDDGYSVFVVPGAESEVVSAKTVVRMSYTANVVVAFKGSTEVNAEAFCLLVQDIKDFLRFRPLEGLEDVCAFSGIVQDPYLSLDAMDQSGLLVSTLAVTYESLRH